MFLHGKIPPRASSNSSGPKNYNLHGSSADIPSLSADCLDELEVPSLHQSTNNEEATQGTEIEVATQRKAICPKKAS